MQCLPTSFLKLQVNNISVCATVNRGSWYITPYLIIVKSLHFSYMKCLKISLIFTEQRGLAEKYIVVTYYYAFTFAM